MTHDRSLLPDETDSAPGGTSSHFDSVGLVTHRRFLQVSSLASAGLLAGCGFHEKPAGRPAAAGGSPIFIDTHTHFYDPDRPEGVPWPSKQDPFLYRTILPRHYKALPLPQRVHGTVVVEASPWVEDNQWILDLAAQDTFIVGLVGNLPVGDPSFPDHLRRFARNPLFRGLRIGSDKLRRALSERPVVRHLEHLADRDLSLDLLIGPGDLPHAAELARRIKTLRVIVDHVANLRIDGGPPPAEWVDGMARVAAHPNTFCKVSGLVEGTGKSDGTAPKESSYYEPVLQTIWRVFGEDRLIYGSNWPVSERFAPCGTVQGIVHAAFQARGQAALTKVFAANAWTAYRWIQRS